MSRKAFWILTRNLVHVFGIISRDWGRLTRLTAALLLLYTSVYAFVHHCVTCESVSVLLSAHLPSSPSVQRLPNSEHHVAEIRFINKSSCCSQQFLQLLAACCLIF